MRLVNVHCLEDFVEVFGRIDGKSFKVGFAGHYLVAVLYPAVLFEFFAEFEARLRQERYLLQNVVAVGIHANVPVIHVLIDPFFLVGTALERYRRPAEI